MVATFARSPRDPMFTVDNAVSPDIWSRSRIIKNNSKYHVENIYVTETIIILARRLQWLEKTRCTILANYYPG
jgi:hypothetical protein